MSVSVIIPAYQAADRIAATVAGARQVAGVAEIIVVDDGSRDGTAGVARAAGADQVIALPHNRGKGQALRAGVEVASGDTLLFLDADLGETAAQAGPLLDAIAGREAMSIAVLPSHGRGGGFGLAKGLAAAVIRLFTGLRVAAPLSGQRALPAAVVRHIGIAPRWGVEVALTCEAAHLGIPIIEVPVSFAHRPTGRDVAGFGHRFRQFSDVLRYALLVGYGLGWPALTVGRVWSRFLLWVLALAALIEWEKRATIGRTLLIAVQRLRPPASAFPDVPPLWGTPIFSAGWFFTLLGAVALLLYLPSLWISAVALRSRKTNYLGRSLPGAAGLLIPLTALVAVLLLRPLLPFWAAMAVVTVGFGLVGLLDDLYGHLGKARGLHGHFRALVQGRVTTGALKAVGGLAVAALAAYLALPESPWFAIIVVDALVIALTANLLNLLDLRPGRALKGFLLLATPMLIAAVASPDRWSYLLLPLAPALAAALVLAPADLAGRVMLGDVGANTLGGLAGLALVLALPPYGRITALVALVAIHLYCERASLTDLIARKRILSFLDRLGTRHLPPLEMTEVVK